MAAQADEKRFSLRTVVAIAVFLFLASVVWFASESANVSLDLFERGHWLGPASDMLAGKIPYRGTFPVHGFLADGGLDFLLFRCFGPSLRVSLIAHRLLSSFFQPALFLVAAAATRKLGAAVLAIPLNIGFATGIQFDRPVVALLSLTFFLLALDSRQRPTPAFAAGLLAALGLLYSLEFGTFVLLGELATLAAVIVTGRWRDPLFPVWPFLAGLASVFLPFAVLLEAHGALWPFLRVSFVDLPSRIDSAWGMPFPAPWQVLNAWIHKKDLFVGALRVGPGVAKRLYLCPLLAAFGIGLSYLLWRGRRWRPEAFRILALSLCCGLFFRYVVARLHLEHGNALIGPLFLAVLVGLWQVQPPFRDQSQRWLRLGLFAAVGALTALLMNAPARVGLLAREAAAARNRGSDEAGLVPLNIRRGGGVLVREGEARYVEQVVHFFDRQVPVGCKVLDLSNEPALYFFLKRRNPTRFYQVPIMAPFQDEVLRDLRLAPPAAVILETGSGLDRIDGIENSVRIPAVWKYVNSNYPRRERVAGTVIAFPATTPSAERDFLSGPAGAGN